MIPRPLAAGRIIDHVPDGDIFFMDESYFERELLKDLLGEDGDKDVKCLVNNKTIMDLWNKVGGTVGGLKRLYLEEDENGKMKIRYVKEDG